MHSLLNTSFITLLTTLIFFVQFSIAGYVLEDDYSPSNFFDMFSFWTSSDPTNGFVDYVDQTTAASEGYIINSTTVYIGTDHKNVTPNGRPSVRLTSNKSYNSGSLIILDLEHMPGGICGTWPAFWMVGPNWPAGGEIDIIEGVNLQTTNAMTLHTSNGCSITDNNNFTGTITTDNCYIYADGQSTNAGCDIGTTQTSTYGTGFNAVGGGVYATEWTDSAISIWFFQRGSIPSDITNGVPTPSAWGKPMAQFQGGCDIPEFFSDNQIVFDLTYCGDWAGNVWSSSACASKADTCNAFVENNPSAFANAYWLINSLKTYQASTTSEDKVSTSRTSSKSSTTSRASSSSKSSTKASTTTSVRVTTSTKQATTTPTSMKKATTSSTLKKTTTSNKPTTLLKPQTTIKKVTTTTTYKAVVTSSKKATSSAKAPTTSSKKVTTSTKKTSTTTKKLSIATVKKGVSHATTSTVKSVAPTTTAKSLAMITTTSATIKSLATTASVKPLASTTSVKSLATTASIKSLSSTTSVKALVSTTSMKSLASTTSVKAPASTTSVKALVSTTPMKSLASTTSVKASASTTSVKAPASTTSVKALASTSSGTSLGSTTSGMSLASTTSATSLASTTSSTTAVVDNQIRSSSTSVAAKVTLTPSQQVNEAQDLVADWAGSTSGSAEVQEVADALEAAASQKAEVDAKLAAAASTSAAKTKRQLENHRRRFRRRAQ